MEAKRVLYSFLNAKLTPRHVSMITINIDKFLKKCLKKNENEKNELQRTQLQQSINDVKDELSNEKNIETVKELIREIRLKIRNLMVTYGVYCMMMLRKESE